MNRKDEASGRAGLGRRCTFVVVSFRYSVRRGGIRLLHLRTSGR